MNRQKKSSKKKNSGKKKSELNKFFDKIFVINLFDKTERWKKVSSQFKRRGIDVERFIAIDGRCKDQGEKGCLDKLKTFEIIYDVEIPKKQSNGKSHSLKTLIPASSLTIGTVLLLRAQVKNNWERILICEDDIELSRNIEDKFKKGVRDLPKDWDLLYLGCGNLCGNEGISFDKSRKNKHLSTLSQFINEDFYVRYKNDLRSPCENGCEKISDYLSVADNPGGTWCYSCSLRGAKKILKAIGKNVGNHIDQIYKDNVQTDNLKAYSFDPPIVMHEEGAIRSDTDIPWEW